MASNSKQKYIDMEWKIFWRLTILKELENRKSIWWRNQRWVSVKCECGTIKDVRLDRLTWKETSSCWCLQKEAIIKTWKNNNKWYKNIAVYIRSSKEYKEWRTKCFERDNYTCQISWQKWWDLVVHHLEPFNLIITDIDIDNYYNDIDLWNIDNWITITKELHNNFHKEYSNKYFTKQNFLEFKNKYNAFKQ